MYLALYYDAFYALHSCRPSGMGPGPIPWTGVQEYCGYYGLDDEQQEDMHYFITELDHAYLKWYKETHKNG